MTNPDRLCDQGLTLLERFKESASQLNGEGVGPEVTLNLFCSSLVKVPVNFESSPSSTERPEACPALG